MIGGSIIDRVEQSVANLHGMLVDFDREAREEQDRVYGYKKEDILTPLMKRYPDLELSNNIKRDVDFVSAGGESFVVNIYPKLGLIAGTGLLRPYRVTDLESNYPVKHVRVYSPKNLKTMTKDQEEAMWPIIDEKLEKLSKFGYHPEGDVFYMTCEGDIMGTGGSWGTEGLPDFVSTPIYGEKVYRNISTADFAPKKGTWDKASKDRFLDEVFSTIQTVSKFQTDIIEQYRAMSPNSD